MSANVGGNPYFEDQWHLDANGQQTEFDPTSPTFDQTLAEIDNNVIEAWEQLVTGAGVQIGIISGGFDLTHEDLVGAFATELAINTLDGTAGTGFTSTIDTNGTAISGIIGARNNDQGIVGIAYNADLVPIRALPDPAFTDGSLADPTEADNAARAQALRYRLGLVQDTNGDGIVDGTDTDGDGIIDGLAANEVIDVYFVSGAVNSSAGRGSEALPDNLLESIRVGANSGRSRWDDLDGDGIFDLDEITSLGAIYVVPAGNDNGNGFDIADPTGFYESSQYSELANSRYTIAVGAVDYDGRYENNATGLVTSFAEMGSNVLIVAPSGTDQADFAGDGDGDLNSGVLTTDLTGEDGRNALPDAFLGEIDGGDYFPDTNYTSTFGGTEAAAAQVTATIALMLEANPDLSRRDVEQILLMSAKQIDQFSETWVTNGQTYFSANYQIPIWTYYNLDTELGGDPEIPNAIIPNHPLVNLDAFDPFIVRGYFQNNPDLTIENLGGFNTDGIPTDDMGNFLTIQSSTAGIDPDDIVIFFEDSIAGQRVGIDDVINPASLFDNPLRFENGAGYTVSSGYGRYLEEIGYAHGLLDAGLAVELASKWKVDSDFDAADNGLFKGREISISTPIIDPATSFAIQGRANISLTPDGPILLVPGGFGTDAINNAFFTEFARPIGVETIEFETGQVGEVITDAPFYDPDGDLDLSPNAGATRIPIQFDDDISTDFLSIESFEFRAAFDSGDIDHIRVSLVSPDGTQTELSPYRLPPGIPNNFVFQRSQFGQGTPSPGSAVLSPRLGGTNFAQDFIGGSENPSVGGGNVGLTDALDPGEVWTWTTNRHYGELFSTKAGGIFDSTGTLGGLVGSDDAWYVVIENWGTGTASLDGYQASIHGTEVTGQRIQGKVGVDDNAQGVLNYNLPVLPNGATTPNPTPEQLGDGVFNFERHLEFGEVLVDPTPAIDPITGFNVFSGDEEILTVVLDDTTDSVDLDKLNDPFGNRVYRTVDPSTGAPVAFPIVDLDAYLFSDSGALQSQLTQFDPIFAGALVLPSLTRTDGLVFGAEDGSVARYQNYDYSQESFAAGVTVTSTQYRVTYDNAGNPVGREATGVKQRFVTGADGNYYFDVDSIPAPPDASVDPAAYSSWFADFGFTFEYDITVVGEDERLWDREYTIDDQEDPRSQVQYNGGGTYTVQLFDAENVLNGETTTVRDVNFLLAVDLAEIQVTVNGTVVQDIDQNDGVRGLSDGVYENVRVYYDSNNNNAYDVGEVETLSAADGSYELMFDPAGEETVSIRLDETTYPEPVRAIAPIVAGEAEFVLTNFDPGDLVTQDFFLKPTASFVQGTVWQDEDEDRQFDIDEVAVDGTALGRNGTDPAIFVYEDANNNNVFDTGEQRVDVAADGTYVLRFANPGDYNIRIDLTNADVSQTFPAGNGSQIVSLVAEQTAVDINFGVKDLRVFDYGDLPDSYGSLLESDGARHRVSTLSFLGSGLPDRELNATPTFNADGDDNDGIDDEDGVVFVSQNVVANSTVEFDITATGGGSVLNAWIDFNNDGVFTSDEQIFDDEGALGTGSTMRISAPTPANVAAADRYAARFRWGPFGLGPTGAANAGEVEDLWLTPEAIVVSGNVRLDADNDAVFETTDTPRQGVRVFIDENLDGIRNPTEPSSVTDAAGNYTFNVVPDGIDTPITIRAEESTLGMNVGFLNPASGIIADLGDPGEQITANFLLTTLPRPTQVITGSIFSDLDNDGLNDGGAEVGLEGITVQLLRNTDADPELEVVATTTTNPSGVYSFVAADTGQYRVRVLPPLNTQQVSTTGGNVQDVAVQTDQTVTVPSFGIFDIRSTFTRDYGDLRVGGGDNYPTTALQGGPSHLVDGVNFLGAGVDADSGSLTSFNAAADDNDFTDDEDGVQLLSPEIVAGQEFSFNVTATGDASSRLNVWVDFDDNGVFDTDEQIVTDLALASGETTKINRFANADTSPTATLLATRVRWGTAGVGSDDADLDEAERDAIVGEVEDLFFRTSQPGVPVNPGLIVGDFNGNGVVSEADRAVWRDSFGLVGANLPADANGNGRVDAADYAIWRDAMSAPLALATSQDEGDTGSEAAPIALATAVPQPVQMPIVETEPEPVFEPASFDAGAFAPLTLVSPQVASAIDESLSVDVEVADDSGDALDAALLEWSLSDAGDDNESQVEELAAEEDEEAEATDEALAAAFAL